MECLEHDTYLFNTVSKQIEVNYIYICTRCVFFQVFFRCLPDYVGKKLKTIYYTMSTSGRQLLAAFLTATS